MPFRSEAQRRYLWAKEPGVAREWAEKYGSKVQPKKRSSTGRKATKRRASSGKRG